jgi:hypothetical protein
VIVRLPKKVTLSPGAKGFGMPLPIVLASGALRPHVVWEKVKLMPGTLGPGTPGRLQEKLKATPGALGRALTFTTLLKLADWLVLSMLSPTGGPPALKALKVMSTGTNPENGVVPVLVTVKLPDREAEDVSSVVTVRSTVRVSWQIPPPPPLKPLAGHR